MTQEANAGASKGDGNTTTAVRPPPAGIVDEPAGYRGHVGDDGARARKGADVGQVSP